MRKRVLYGWGLFFIAVAALVSGGLIFTVFLGTLAVLAGNEFIAMMNVKGLKPSPRIIRGMTIAFFVMASLQKLIQLVPGTNNLKLPPEFPFQHFPLLLTTGVCISFFRLLFRHEHPPATI